MTLQPSHIFRFFTKGFLSSIITSKHLRNFPKDLPFKFNANFYYLAGYKKRLVYACFHDTTLILLNTDFTIVTTISLGLLRKLGLRKKADLAFIFDDKKQNKFISLLSNFNRQAFCQELRDVVSNLIIDSVDHEKSESIVSVIGNAERIFFIRLLIQLMEEPDKGYRILQLINYFNQIIFKQTPNSIYQYQGYRNAIMTERGKIWKKNLFLYFTNLEVIYQTVIHIFFSFKNLSFDKKKLSGYGNFIKKMILLRKKEKELELSLKTGKRKVSQTSSNSKFINRIRHNMVESKKRSKKTENKCEYKNIQFTYYSIPNHNKKNPKIITLSTVSITVLNQYVSFYLNLITN